MRRNSTQISFLLLLLIAFLPSEVAAQVLRNSDYRQIRGEITGTGVTEYQIQNILSSNEGKRVHWSGWIEQVKADGTVLIDMDPPSVIFSNSDVVLTDLSESTLGQLRKGSEVTFTGSVASMEHGGSLEVEIDDANLVANDTFKQESATTKKNKRPPTPVIVKGVCPFECCTYGEWKATDPIKVFDSEGDTGDPIFTIGEGETFTAHDGNVHVSQTGVAVVEKPIDISDGNAERTLAVGDTLYALNYLGEGYGKVWFDGSVWTSGAYRLWNPDQRSHGEGPKVTVIRPVQTQWWARVTDWRGRSGWILMSESEVTGDDACA